MIRYNFIFDTVGACVRLGGNEENGRQWGRNNEVRKKAYFLGGGGGGGQFQFTRLINELF